MMIQEFMHMGMDIKDSDLSFLVMMSLYKDDFPWLYEIGLDTYRGLKSAKNLNEKKKIISSFERAFDMLGHPLLRDMYSKSEDMYFMMKDSRHIMHEYLHRVYHIEETQL